MTAQERRDDPPRFTPDRWGRLIVRLALVESSTRLRTYAGRPEFRQLRAFWLAVADALIEHTHSARNK